MFTRKIVGGLVVIVALVWAFSNPAALADAIETGGDRVATFVAELSN